MFITFQAVLTPSANLPESPVGRPLKRSFAALHFLTRTKAIACEACLATERFRTRWDITALFRGALATITVRLVSSRLG